LIVGYFVPSTSSRRRGRRIYRRPERSILSEADSADLVASIERLKRARLAQKNSTRRSLSEVRLAGSGHGHSQLEQESDEVVSVVKTGKEQIGASLIQRE
jgi:hypothetical protein